MKEDVRPKDGKRKLYFSLDMHNFITYTLEQKTTCETIYKTHKNDIIAKFTKLYNNPNIDLSNFDFYLIDLKEIDKFQGNFISRVKLNWKIYIYNFLQNQKTILCYMQRIPIAQNQPINRNPDNQIKVLNQKLEDMKKSYLNAKQIENFFINKTVFLYDYKTKVYTKYKANLSEKQFTIHTGKTDTIIYIQDITSIEYFNAKHPVIDTLTVVSGYKPAYFIVLKNEENQWVIGLKTEEKLIKWRKGFDSVFINLSFFMNDINFNIQMNNYKNSIAQNEIKIITDPINVDNLINIKLRKMLFYKNIKDTKLLQLVEDILIYKKMILSEDYNCAKETLNKIIEENKEENKKKNSNIGQILTNEIINEFKELYNKANENSKEENKEQLKDLLKIDLFDKILEELNKFEINPFINKCNEEISQFETTNNESNTKKNMANLISYNCLKDYKMNKLDSFLEL